MMDIDVTEDDVGWCDGLMLLLLLIGDDGCWMMDIDATEDDVGWCDGLMLMLLLIGDDG